MTDLAQREPQQIQSLRPRSYGQIIKLARMACESGMVPKAFADDPQKTAIAMMMLAENELPIITGLKFVAVINGQPAFYSDAVPGIARKRGLIKRRKEWWEGSGESLAAHCEVVNSDGDTFHSKFSVADARRANLWSKDTYKQYPERMLMWRARSYAIRDAAPDAFMGPTVEELEALATAFVGPDHAKEINPQASEPAQPQQSKMSVIAALNPTPQREATVPPVVEAKSNIEHVDAVAEHMAADRGHAARIETAAERALASVNAAYQKTRQDFGVESIPHTAPGRPKESPQAQAAPAPVAASQEPPPPAENAPAGQQSAIKFEAVIGDVVYWQPRSAADALILLTKKYSAPSKILDDYADVMEALPDKLANEVLAAVSAGNNVLERKHADAERSASAKTDQELDAPKRRGRPPGSKNRPSEPAGEARSQEPAATPAPRGEDEPPPWTTEETEPARPAGGTYYYLTDTKGDVIDKDLTAAAFLGLLESSVSMASPAEANTWKVRNGAALNYLLQNERDNELAARAVRLMR